jgi:hypothetical protein
MVNRSRSTKQKKTRRTKAEIDALKDSIISVLQEIQPATGRQVFYQLASYLQVIRKTEAQYKSTVIRLLSKMRRDKTIPFEWLSDNTRWMRKPTSYSSLEALLRNTAATYRRSVWDQQDAYVEVWLEKDALAGVFYDVTAVWDVPLMVTRGFPSISFLYSASEVIADHAWNGKEIFIYYFGDRDPSGLTVDRTVERDLKEFAEGAEINFQRVAVTPEQIAEWDLPTRPTKRTGNKHAKGFIGDSVELDAIPPAKLRELIESCITQHLNPTTHNALVAAEQSERATLAAFINRFRGNGERDLDHAN